MKRNVIYAVDFDGTLCKSIYPGIGEPNISLINYLKRKKLRGKTTLILWTCRCGDDLQEAIAWCRRFGLKFDYVNENVPEMVEKHGSNSRKIFADVYIDDKAINKPKWNVPFKKEW